MSFMKPCIATLHASRESHILFLAKCCFLCVRRITSKMMFEQADLLLFIVIANVDDGRKLSYRLEDNQRWPPRGQQQIVCCRGQTYLSGRPYFISP